jgi:hypothetical protein
MLDSFPAFYGTRRFNTEFTRALHLFLSLARPIQSMSPHPNSSISVLSTYLCLGVPTGLFDSLVHTNIFLRMQIRGDQGMLERKQFAVELHVHIQLAYYSERSGVPPQFEGLLGCLHLMW